jgi:hypothetical protein
LTVEKELTVEKKTPPDGWIATTRKSENQRKVSESISSEAYYGL